jgi:hypothetical protein
MVSSSAHFADSIRAGGCRLPFNKLRLHFVMPFIRFSVSILVIRQQRQATFNGLDFRLPRGRFLRHFANNLESWRFLRVSPRSTAKIYSCLGRRPSRDPDFVRRITEGHMRSSSAQLAPVQSGELASARLRDDTPAMQI